MTLKIFFNFYIEDFPCWDSYWHYIDVIMTRMASQITSQAVVYSIVYSGADQRKHHSAASPKPVNSPHKGPVTRKMFPFDDVVMGFEFYMISYGCTNKCIEYGVTVEGWYIATINLLPRGKLLKKMTMMWAFIYKFIHCLSYQWLL